MFHFMKKSSKIEEPVLEDITEEQLGQVAGGDGGNGLLNMVSGITGLTTQQMDGVYVSSMQARVGGVTVGVPAITPSSLLP